eukprot:4567284-Prymnesium_polylepis.1
MPAFLLGTRHGRNKQRAAAAAPCAVSTAPSAESGRNHDENDADAPAHARLSHRLSQRMNCHQQVADGMRTVRNYSLRVTSTQGVRHAVEAAVALAEESAHHAAHAIEAGAHHAAHAAEVAHHAAAAGFYTLSHIQRFFSSHMHHLIDLLKLDRRQRREEAIVDEALEVSRVLTFPMALLPFDLFKEAGRLSSHEE